MTMPAIATTPITPLADNQYPDLFRKADATSVRKKRNYYMGERAEIALLIVGAVAGLGSLRVSMGGMAVDWLGLVAAAAFFFSLLIQFYRFQNQPDSIWYAARAIAESTKKLTWLYIAGGNPFPKFEENPMRAETLFLSQLNNVLEQTTNDENRALFVSDGHAEITSAMRTLRNQSLEERRTLYHTGRLADQQRWYARKAKSSKKLADRWSFFLQAVEFIGVIIALLKAIGLIPLDLLSIVALVAAAGTSWLQLQQHRSLEQAYSIAAVELQKISDRIDEPSTEAEWATFVNQAEEAISREHTAWIATHISPAIMRER